MTGMPADIALMAISVRALPPALPPPAAGALAVAVVEEATLLLVHAVRAAPAPSAPMPASRPRRPRTGEESDEGMADLFRDSSGYGRGGVVRQVVPVRVARRCRRTAPMMIRPLAMFWVSVARLLRMKMLV